MFTMQKYKELQNQTAEYKHHKVKVYHANRQDIDNRYVCFTVMFSFSLNYENLQYILLINIIFVYKIGMVHLIF